MAGEKSVDRGTTMSVRGFPYEKIVAVFADIETALQGFNDGEKAFILNHAAMHAFCRAHPEFDSIDFAEYCYNMHAGYMRMLELSRAAVAASSVRVSN